MIQMAEVVQIGWLSLVELELVLLLIAIGIVSASTGLQTRNPHLLTCNM